MPKHEQERLLLYLDILGFRRLVSNGDPGHVRQVLNAALDAVEKEQKRRLHYRTIYFSDTILLYRHKPGFDESELSSLHHAACIVYRSLVGADIPVSGVITYGAFTSRMRENGEHQVYFGQALVDAYDCDKKEKWIGLLICPSVTGQMKESEIAEGEVRGTWKCRRQEEEEHPHLLLNPFKPLLHHYRQERDSGHRIRLEAGRNRALKALAFLHGTAESFAAKGDFSSGPAIRYHATVSFARAVLSNECYEWAIRRIEARRKRRTSRASHRRQPAP